MDSRVDDELKKHSVHNMVLSGIDEAFHTTGATPGCASLQIVIRGTRLTVGEGTASKRYGHGYALSLKTTSSLSM
jgi:hypothetical protein